MNPRRWLHEHSLKLLAIRDTPEAIAGGVAIGLFFGFTPLFGLRFLASMFFAWLTRSNILAAVLATTLHDVILPLMPVIYRWQYDVGFWLLRQPHHWPPPLHKTPWEQHYWWGWSKRFLTHRLKDGCRLIRYYVSSRKRLLRFPERRGRPASTQKASPSANGRR